MSELDHTVWVLSLKRGNAGSEPEHPRDIIGQCFYLTEREAEEAIEGTGIAPAFVGVHAIDLRKPWTMGMAPRE